MPKTGRAKPHKVGVQNWTDADFHTATDLADMGQYTVAGIPWNCLHLPNLVPYSFKRVLVRHLRVNTFRERCNELRHCCHTPNHGNKAFVVCICVKWRFGHILSSRCRDRLPSRSPACASSGAPHPQVAFVFHPTVRAIDLLQSDERVAVPASLCCTAGTAGSDCRRRRFRPGFRLLMRDGLSQHVVTPPTEDRPCALRLSKDCVHNPRRRYKRDDDK